MSKSPVLLSRGYQIARNAASSEMIHFLFAIYFKVNGKTTLQVVAEDLLIHPATIKDAHF